MFDESVHLVSVVDAGSEMRVMLSVDLLTYVMFPSSHLRCRESLVTRAPSPEARMKMTLAARLWSRAMAHR